MKSSFIRYLILLTLGLLLALGFRPAHSQPVPAENGPSSVPTEVSPSSFLEQGRSHYQQSQWNEAISAWQSALEQPNISEQQQATLWSYLGMAYGKVGDWDAGESAIANTLQYLENLPENSDSLPESPRHRAHLLAQTLNAQGQLSFAQGRPESALASWQAATDIYQTLNYATGITGTLINQSRAFETLGHYRRACQTLLIAIDLADQSCDVNSDQTLDTIIQAFEHQPNATLQSLGLRSLGQVLRLTGQYPEAHQLLEKSVNISKEQDLQQQYLLSLLSLAQIEQDLIKQASDRFKQTSLEVDRSDITILTEQALSRYTVAESLARSLTGDNGQLLTQTIIQRFSLLATIQSTAANNSLSIDITPQLQDQFLKVKNLPSRPPSRAAIYTNIQLAKAYITLLPSPFAPPLTDTATLLTETHQQAITLNDIQAQSYALGTLGHLYEQAAIQDNRQETWQQAKQVTKTALQLAQTAQSAHIAYQWQWQLGRIYTAQQSSGKAITAYQTAAQTLQTLRQDLVAIDAEAQFSFRDNVEPLYREFVALLVQTSADTSPSQQNLAQAIQEIDALQLTELENFLSCNLTQTFQLSEPQTDSTTAIIYPIILADQLAVITRLPQTTAQKQTATLQFHHITIPEADITQVLSELRQQAENRYLSNELLERSQQVYDWIIKPIEPQLNQQNIQTLVFVSDGALRNVPMGILHNGQHFLIEDYAIAVSPGLQLPQAKSLDQLQLDAIAFGLSEIRSDFQPHSGFAPLTNVENELATINTQLPSRQYLNQDFTAHALQSLGDSRSASIIHLATHGQFSSDPDATYLLAWDQQITLHDFGQILQNQTTSETSNIELLILSACKTASGDTRATLGLAGVAIQSGASSTIASLWSVDDQSTAELMIRLYQKLGQSSVSLSRAEILRQAQLELMHTPGYQAPFYWAPYVLIGNWA